MRLSLRSMQALWPQAALAGPATAQNYVSTDKNTYDSYNGIVKIDHQFSEKYSVGPVLRRHRRTDGLRRGLAVSRLPPGSAEPNAQRFGCAVDELGGAVVTWAPPTANDLVDGVVPVRCLPQSDTMFALGVTEVTCTATDLSGDVAIERFNVRDSVPPSVAVTSSVSVNGSAASLVQGSALAGIWRATVPVQVGGAVVFDVRATDVVGRGDVCRQRAEWRDLRYVIGRHENIHGGGSGTPPGTPRGNRSTTP